MNINDKVTYNSMTGSVTAKVVAVSSKAYCGSMSSLEYVTLKSTSRSNEYYPAGFEWDVPAGAASLVPRP